MKTSSKVVSAVVLLFGTVIINTTIVYSQCKLISENSIGEQIIYEVSCDFPVYSSTGDYTVDDKKYEDAMKDWCENHTDGCAILSTANIKYIVIPGDIYVTMPFEKQVAIKESSKYSYRVE